MNGKRSSGVARSVLALGASALAACTIWAAIDNPYKSELDASAAVIVDGSAVDGAAGDASPDAIAEGGVDGSADAGAARATNRVLDAGFVPSGIGSYGDTVYAVDDEAQVHVAYDASTSFTSFWTGDAGGRVLVEKNGVAASAAGVFWTVSGGVHYCGMDAGDCGFLGSTNAREIAASDSVVAWIDDTGVRACTVPMDTCNPVTLVGSKTAESVAAGPNGAVAWIAGDFTIHIANGVDAGIVDLDPDEVDVIATDATSGALYWEGQDGIGFLQFDGGGESATDMLTSNTKPTALFVNRGLLYWSLATSNTFQHCRLAGPDAGCTPVDLAATGLPSPQTTHGIVVTSRRVLALVSSGQTAFLPALVEWPVPP